MSAFDDAYELLGRASLFKDFTETGRRIFAEIAVMKVVPAGTPLFVEDRLGESLFIVKSGAVRITRREGSAERDLAVLGPGDHLGGLALLAPCVRLVTAVASTACEVLEITHREFARKAPDKPQACLKLALAVAADLGRQVGECREALRELVPGGRNPAG